MPKEKTVRPAVESLPLSNFLTVEVSEKKKAELDKILICKPDLVEVEFCLPFVCLPAWCYPARCFPKCIPMCTPFCRPRICVPYRYGDCPPTLCMPVQYELSKEVCTPSMVTARIPPEELYELYGEMKEMFTALGKVKAEIAEIKKKISK